MIKNIYIDLLSNDKRIGELKKLFESEDVHVVDFSEKVEGADEKNTVAVLAPRFVPTKETFLNIPKGSAVFGYAKALTDDIVDGRKYVCLSDDEEFIRENNHLTSLAMREILVKRYEEISGKQVLVIGAGKLFAELEPVLLENECVISVLNFNHHKTPELTKKYGDKALFEFADLSKFQIIINTIPSKVIGEKMLRTLSSCGGCKKMVFKSRPAIYELASEPYGFDWDKLDAKEFDYIIEPALPGRYYPDKAAVAIHNAVKRHVENIKKKPSIVLCVTGSACSYTKLPPILEELVEKYDVIPVLSNAANSPNRFGNIEEFRKLLYKLAGNTIVTTIAGSELLSSNKNIVASLVFPATGNTIAKLANAITDTPVTMAVKALLRNAIPCVVGISTNDALSGNASNIGTLLNRRNYYFVPFSQDDINGKPFSCVCNFSKVVEAVDAGIKGKQLQPIIS